MVEDDIQEIKDEFWALQECEWSKEIVKKLLKLAEKCQSIIRRIKLAGDNRSEQAKMYFHDCKQELNSLKQRILNYCAKMQSTLDVNGKLV